MTQHNLPPLLRRLQLMKQEVGAASARVADRILADPEAFLSMTIADLSAVSHASEATVVRLVGALGFGSYQEFKLQLSRTLGSRAVDYTVTPHDTAAQVLQKTFGASASALSDTLEHVQLSAFAQVSALLLAARRTEFIGSGASGLLAQEAEYRAQRLGLMASAQRDPGNYLPACALMEPSDVLVAISFSGQTPDILRAAKLARANGAAVVALSGLGRSPLSRLAQHVLVASAAGDHYRPEQLAARVPQLCLLDALFTSLHLAAEPYLSQRLSRAQGLQSQTPTQVGKAR